MGERALYTEDRIHKRLLGIRGVIVRSLSLKMAGVSAMHESVAYARQPV